MRLFMAASLIWDLGLLAFLISFGLDTYLAASLRCSKFRAFFAFLIVDSVRGILLATILRSYGFYEYSTAYWFTRPVYLCAAAAVAAELAGRPRLAWIALPIGLAEYALLAARLGELMVTLDNLSALTLAASFVYLAVSKAGKASWIAAGFAVSNILALAAVNGTGPFRMVRLFSYMIGQGIWLASLRERQTAHD